MITPGTYLAIVLYTLPGFVFGSVIHELSHNAVALRGGDPTPRRDGRMTLDPRRNLDPLGCLAMLVAGVGWGRPVKLDPLYLREGRQRAAVAAAGPLAHLVVAAVFAGALRVELLESGIDASGFVILAQFTLQGIILGVLLQGFLVNIALFVFNALPIPGLDGYAVVRALLFSALPRVFLYLEQYRHAIYALVALALLLPPPLTHGAFDLASAMTVGTASLTFDHLIMPGVQPLFLGLPNLFHLLS
ncbi:MAG: site-2 protease family protein [Candidatus Dormiibacterota bacterium]